MSSQKIFLFDFDGVIVDGMQEYWHSSLLACEKYLNSPNISVDQKLYKRVPNSFKEIRPWVKYGWEMILIVHEIIKTENPLKNDNKDDFINNYHQNCQRILNDNSWFAEDLQKLLDKSRKYQIDKDFKSWVNLHKPFFEIIKTENPLKHDNKDIFINNYHQNCKRILIDNSWNAEDLQKILDKSRKFQIDKDFKSWVKLHNPFFEVLNFMKELRKREIKTGIITTKGGIFAEKILKELNIFPEFIFGYESGTKIKIAAKLSKNYEILGFIEDRKKTLIEIKQNYKTSHIPCLLADWGYLKELDRYNLSNEIKLLKLNNLKELVAF